MVPLKSQTCPYIIYNIYLLNALPYIDSLFSFFNKYFAFYILNFKF